MIDSPDEYFTSECPNGHRIRGDVGWLDRRVKCPRCNTAFVFRRADDAGLAVGPGGSRVADETIVSDSSVMQILGDLTAPALQDDGTIRHCTNCGATYPSYVQSCYNCNLELTDPVDSTQESEQASEVIDFQAVNPFPFTDVSVRKVMRPRKDIEFLELSSSFTKILNWARSTAHTRYPVCDGNLEKVVGLVHVEDIVLANEGDFSIKKVVRPIDLFPESLPVSEALHRLQKSGEPIALVVDEYQTVIGMVTVKDIMLKMPRKT